MTNQGSLFTELFVAILAIEGLFRDFNYFNCRKEFEQKNTTTIDSYPFVGVDSFVDFQFVFLVASVATAAAHETFGTFRSAVIDPYVSVEIGL